MLFDMKDPMTIQLGDTKELLVTSTLIAFNKVTDTERVGYEDLEVLIDIYMYRSPCSSLDDMRITEPCLYVVP